MGCAKTVSTIRPEPRQGLGLSLELESDYAMLKENDSHLLGRVGNPETYYITSVEGNVPLGCLIGGGVVVVAVVLVCYLWLVVPFSSS